MQSEKISSNRDQIDLAACLRGYSMEIGTRDIDQLEQLSSRIPPGSEVFINILAGERLEDRVSTCSRIKALGLVPVPHIAAVRLTSEAELADSLQQLMTQGGAQDFLVVSGDGAGAGPYTDSLELVQWIVENHVGIRSLGITGYPEGHPDKDSRVLRSLLEQKLQLLRGTEILPFVTLQFSFDAQAITDWCRDFHQRHPNILVRAGLPGPASLTSLMRFAQRCGVKSSMSRLKSLPLASSFKLLQRVPPLAQARAIGHYRETENRNLVAHMFNFGGLAATLDWVG
jgi:methylenetetrahydrofolate reductase (NADPH)